jgi:pyruvate/2-oxoglutarate dehydrogenase complex dihydrolipoamide dehydrogenase (E3) component
MIDGETAFHLNAYAQSGAELIMGRGRLVGTNTIEVALNDGGARVVAGDQLVINVGTHAAIPEIPGLAAARPLTHIEALELADLPSHLIVLGGGYVGVELAQAFRRFGSRVTIVENGAQLVGREDPDVADGEGVEIVLNAKLVGVTGLSGDAVTLTARMAEGEREIAGSHLLVAVGRVPNTADIGLETAGVELDPPGYIRVNERLETTSPGAWAIGECAGSPQFTHVSVDDFRIVRDNMAGDDRRTSDRIVPHVVFIDPPLARVGLSETEARRQGISVRVARLPMSNVLRTETTGETHGFIKVLIGANDDHILGFTMIGSEAGEVMAAVQTAMLAGPLLVSARTCAASTRWRAAAVRRAAFAAAASAAAVRACHACSRSGTMVRSISTPRARVARRSSHKRVRCRSRPTCSALPPARPTCRTSPKRP